MNNRKTAISYLESPCGGGKSHAFTEHAIQQSQLGIPTMIVCQTTALLDQYATKIGNQASVFCIHHGNTKGTLNKIYSSLAPLIEMSGVMLITFETFQKLKFDKVSHQFDIIFDETPSSVDTITLNIAESHSIITQYIDHAECDCVHLKLSSNNDTEMTKILENRHKDKTYSIFQELAKKILSPHWTVYVSAAKYYSLLSKTKNDPPEQIDFFAVLNPSIFHGFRSVTIGSANFKDSIIYKLIEFDENFELRENNELAKSLRYKTHTNGSLIDIYYAVNRSWSKNYIIESPVLDKVVSAFRSVIDGRPYVWSANNEQNDNLFAAGGANRLPAFPHGLNNFQNFHCVASVGAFNLKPSTIAFLEIKFGLSRDFVRRAINFEVHYQIICRTSIRDPNDRTFKIVCVPDVECALYLQEKFPGSRIHDLGLQLDNDFKYIPTKVRQRKSNYQTKKESLERKQDRKRKRAEEFKLVLDIARQRILGEEVSGVVAQSPSGIPNQSNGKTDDLYNIGRNITHFFGSIWRSKYDVTPLTSLSCDEFDEIVDFIKRFNREK